jgi:hypothetical protein
LERLSGTQITATMIVMTMSALGKPWITTEPTIASRRNGAAAPPGEFRINSATPSHTKSIASVTTISGTRVMTISTPLRNPITMPTASVIRMAGTPPIVSIRTAAVTEQTAIMEATDRSMPPTITTTTMAAVAKAKGQGGPCKAFQARDAEIRLDQPGHGQKHEQQRHQPQRPRVLAHEAHAAPSVDVRP